jgi:hypothetical protein
MQKAIYYVSKLIAARGIIELTDRHLNFQVSHFDASFGIKDLTIDLCTISDVKIGAGDLHPRVRIMCGIEKYEFVLAKGQDLYDLLKSVQENPLTFDLSGTDQKTTVYCRCGKQTSKVYHYCPWCGKKLFHWSASFFCCLVLTDLLFSRCENVTDPRSSGFSHIGTPKEDCMKRIGVAAALLILMTAILASCEETGTETQATGVWVRFQNCVTFPASIYVNDEYWGVASSEEPVLVEVGAGSYTIYAHSTAILVDEDKYFCWTNDVSVSDGQTTDLWLDCNGHLCPPD